jgi:hypothetical protein
MVFVKKVMNNTWAGSHRINTSSKNRNSALTPKSSHFAVRVGSRKGGLLCTFHMMASRTSADDHMRLVSRVLLTSETTDCYAISVRTQNETGLISGQSRAWTTLRRIRTQTGLIRR